MAELCEIGPRHPTSAPGPESQPERRQKRRQRCPVEGRSPWAAASRGFNIIYVPYCSSDAHLGDVAAEDNVAGMPLRGARIVRAAMRHAMAARPGGISAGNLVVFGGVSAGGRGALVHLDTLVPYGVLPEGVRLLGFLDSVDYMEMPTFHGLDSWGHNVTKQTRGVMSLMHNEDRFASLWVGQLAGRSTHGRSWASKEVGQDEAEI